MEVEEVVILTISLISIFRMIFKYSFHIRCKLKLRKKNVKVIKNYERFSEALSKESDNDKNKSN